MPPPVEEIEIPLVTMVIGDGAAGSAGGPAGGGASARDTSSEPQAEIQRSAVSELPAETQRSTAPEPPAEIQTSTAPAPIALPRPPRPRPIPRVVAQAPPPSPTSAVREPQPVTTPLPPTPQTGTAATGQAPSGPGGSAGAGQGNLGNGAGAFGNGEGPGDDYFERLRRHLAKHKRYPPEASKQKQEGTVQVEFTLARDGTVLAARIEKSAGYPLLDQAVLDMLRNASPVPPLPERFTGERIRITLPIGFSLGFFTRVF
jgi:periplasmic protein TonB